MLQTLCQLLTVGSGPERRSRVKKGSPLIHFELQNVVLLLPDGVSGRRAHFDRERLRLSTARRTSRSHHQQQLARSRTPSLCPHRYNRRTSDVGVLLVVRLLPFVVSPSRTSVGTLTYQWAAEYDTATTKE